MPVYPAAEKYCGHSCPTKRGMGDAWLALVYGLNWRSCKPLRVKLVLITSFEHPYFLRRARCVVLAPFLLLPCMPPSVKRCENSVSRVSAPSVALLDYPFTVHIFYITTPNNPSRPDGSTWRWTVQSCSAKEGLGLKEGMDWLAKAVRGKNVSPSRPKGRSRGGRSSKLEGAPAGGRRNSGVVPPPLEVLGAPIYSA